MAFSVFVELISTLPSIITNNRASSIQSRLLFHTYQSSSYCFQGQIIFPAITYSNHSTSFNTMDSLSNLDTLIRLVWHGFVLHNSGVYSSINLCKNFEVLAGIQGWLHFWGLIVDLREFSFIVRTLRSRI